MTRRPLPLVLAALLAGFALAACRGRDDAGGSEPSPSGSATSSATGTGAGTAPATASPSGTAPGTAPAVSPTSTPAASNGGSPGPAEPEGARALEHIRQLATVIGPRLAGGPGERAAVEYIAAEFRRYGYDVELMSFTYGGDRYRAGSISGPGFTVQSLSMSGSPGGDVTGRAIYVGLGDTADYTGKDARGKIAIADRGQFPFSQKVAAAQAAGAVALVVVNTIAEDFSGNAGENSLIPTVGVSLSASEALRAAARDGTTIRLEATGEESTSWDVIARPSPGASCAMLVGGHHDTVPGVPAALDNASGTATTLELARAFAADGIDRGLCFATFGAEESGLFGSNALAARMSAEGNLPRVFVNLDMTGLGDSVDLIGSADLVQRAAAIAATLNITAQETELGPFLGSDHQSFQAKNVPVIFFTSSEMGQLHRPSDTLETINLADLERTGDLAYAFIQQTLPTVA